MRQSGDGSDRREDSLRRGAGPALVFLLACPLLTVTGCGSPATNSTAPSTSYNGGTAPASTQLPTAPGATWDFVGDSLTHGLYATTQAQRFSALLSRNLDAN